MCDIGKIRNVIENEAGPILAPIIGPIIKVKKTIMEPIREYVYVRRIQRMANKNDKR